MKRCVQLWLTVTRSPMAVKSPTRIRRISVSEIEFFFFFFFLSFLCRAQQSVSEAETCWVPHVSRGCRVLIQCSRCCPRTPLPCSPKTVCSSLSIQLYAAKAFRAITTTRAGHCPSKKARRPQFQQEARQSIQRQKRAVGEETAVSNFHVPAQCPG